MARPSEPNLVGDVLVAVGWAVFVGVGIAIGLTLGSLGADIASDSGMATFFGLVTGIATLIFRLLMVAWNHRATLGGRRPTPSRPAPAERAPEREPATVGARPARTAAAPRPKPSSGTSRSSTPKTTSRAAPRTTPKGTPKAAPKAGGQKRASKPASGPGARGATTKRQPPKGGAPRGKG